MKYMLDTDICIYLIKYRSEKLIKKFKTVSVGEVAISSLTFSELVYGVEKSQHRSKNKKALMKFVLPLEILPFEHSAALHYGSIRAELETLGTPIGSMNLIIASHARSSGLTLISNNTKEFKRVSKLKLENWAA